MPLNNPNYMVTIQTYNVDAADGAPIIVSAPLPETFGFDSRSEYQAPYSQGLLGNGALSQVAQLGGVRLTSQALTAQLWQGSTETELSLELDFHTETDPDIDVRQPILKLLKLATATVDKTSGQLQAPGPRLDLTKLSALAGQAGSQLLGSGQQIANAIGSLNKPANLQDPATTSRNSTNSVNGAPTVSGGLGSSQGWKDKIKNQISIRIGRYAFFDSVVITNVQKTYSNQLDAATGLPIHARVGITFRPLFLLVQDDLDKIFARRN